MKRLTLLSQKPIIAVNNLRLLFRNRIWKFRQKVDIYIENDKFIIKTVKTPRELIQVLKLRHQIIFAEFLGTKYCPEYSSIDVDKLDVLFDHIAVIDKKTNKPVGTYRINCTKYNPILYAAEEFDMSSIDNLKEHKIELGRACVHPDYRNGSIILALWKGVGRYSKVTESRYFFGCATLHTENTFHAVITYYLLKDHISDEHKSVTPQKNYQNGTLEWAINKAFDRLEIFNTEEMAKIVPSLLRAYITYGGVICGTPSYNAKLKCFNFLTLIDKTTVPNAFRRRFID